MWPMPGKNNNGVDLESVQSLNGWRTDAEQTMLTLQEQHRFENQS